MSKTEKNFVMPNFEGVEKGSDRYKEVISIRNKVKKEAMALILETISSNKDAYDQKVLDAVEALTPKVSTGRVAGTRGPSKLDVIGEMFTEVGQEVSEDKIFMDHKYGRSEMRSFCRDMVKKAEPTERKWVNFNPETGIYTLEAIGEDAPVNWTGYMPPELTTEAVEDSAEDLTDDADDFEDLSDEL